MNPAVVQVAHVDAQLVADQLADVDVEHLAVVRQRDVHVGSLAEQSADQRGRHIRQTAGLGVQHICHVAHPLGKIGDFRGDDQDGRRFVIGSSHHIGVLLTLPENWRTAAGNGEAASSVSVLRTTARQRGQHMKPGTLLSHSCPAALMRAVSPNRPDTRQVSSQL